MLLEKNLITRNAEEAAVDQVKIPRPISSINVTVKITTTIKRGGEVALSIFRGEGVDLLPPP
jgi:hypothetical protein